MTTVEYDLADRTFSFAQEVRLFLRQTPKDVINFEDIKQLTRSSGSVGANYIEANESLSPKDFNYRLMICKKEAKESIYWLKLLYLANNDSLESSRSRLIKEADELTRIFSAILRKRHQR